MQNAALFLRCRDLVKINLAKKTKFIFYTLLVIVALLVCFITYQAITSQTVNYWLKDKTRTTSDYTLFLGSSSIARLPVPLVSKCKPVVVYGFENGTTESIESYLRFADMQQAKHIVLYIGENDIAQGENYLQTAEQFNDIVSELLNSTDAKISIMTVKPSPRRIQFHADFRLFNNKIKDVWTNVNSTSRVSFIAFDTIRNPIYYVQDGVHLNKRGYQLLSSMINETCV